MRKWTLRLIVLAVLVGGGYLLTLTALSEDPVEVEVFAVAPGRVEATITNSKAGTVKVRRRASISPEIGGRVVEITRAVGDRVKEGEVLVRLDDSLLRARLLNAQRALESAEAFHNEACVSANRARAELNRNIKLEAQGQISEDLLEKLQFAVEAADAACTATQARTAEAEAAVELAQVQLDQAVVRAPFDGIIAEKSLEIGEWVTPSPPMVPVPAILDILDPTSIYISAPMDEVDSALVKAGDRARVTLDPFRGQEFDGSVVRVAPYVLDVESQNRTVEIEVELRDAEFSARLLPGTSADVEVLLEVREDVLRIPSSCVLEGGLVLVLENGMLQEKPIDVGLRNWAYAEIRSGLQEGERVVTSLDRAEVVAGAEARVLGEEETDGGLAASEPDP